MDVDPAQSRSHRFVKLEKCQRFVVLDDGTLRKRLKQGQDLGPLVQTTARELTDDERVTRHFPVSQQRTELVVAASQVIDPDGGVDQDHVRFPLRRRGIRSRARSVPPSVASRCALARAMSASRPACRSAVFSVMPVSRVARSTSPSLRFRVVLIYAYACIPNADVSTDGRGARCLGSSCARLVRRPAPVPARRQDDRDRVSLRGQRHVLESAPIRMWCESETDGPSGCAASMPARALARTVGR